MGLKWWIGPSGKTSTHAVVLGRLIVAGEDHGIHGVVVQLRDGGHMPMPGVTIGDCGPKGGQNGLDNGFLHFDGVRVPVDRLLNRFGDVVDGRYVAVEPSESRRFGATMGELSSGRVHFGNTAVVTLFSAVTIALRYSAVRHQFGPTGRKGEPEWPIFEFQLHRARLVPILAAGLALRAFTHEVTDDFVRLALAKRHGHVDAALGAEMHALTAGSKAYGTWTAFAATQQARECCGGHGISGFSRLAQLRADIDPSLTYEGDNNVMMQQVARFIVMAHGRGSGDKYRTLGYLALVGDAEARAARAWQWTSSDDLERVLSLRAASLLETSFGPRSSGERSWNDSQVHALQPLAVAHMELAIFRAFRRSAARHATTDGQRALERFLHLFGVHVLVRDAAVLLEAGITDADGSRGLKDAFRSLLETSKDDVLGMVDAVAPPDHVLCSVLGASDGRVFTRYLAAVRAAPGVHSRASWWPSKL